MKSAQSELKNLKKQALSGDKRSLARLLTLVEEDFRSLLPFLARVKTHALRIGVTGPPGAGKSTLVNAFLEHAKSRKLRVGVLAVDPSSPFSGGAILGDRVRMSEHFTDEKIFIRSLSSRGHGGGLAAATGAMARVFDLAGFDLLIIETVGVGQTELEIMNLVDSTLLALVPESGDVIQTMKAGILEIADCFVVNKADRPGSGVLAKELEAVCEQESTPRKVFLTEAQKKVGTEDVFSHLLSLAKEQTAERVARRKKGELRSLLIWEAIHKIDKKLSKTKVKDPYQSFLKR